MSLDEFGCDIATGRLDRDGYSYCGKSRGHIVAWVKARGAVPKGLEVEHMCRIRACRAVHHLELVTRSENELRKSMAYRLKRKLCPRGHDLHANRVVTPLGGIVCRCCNEEARSELRR